ncbi:hypothetical protein [Aquamicrobium defluvii]|uniref:hypothetical protein n=1 Tax=Aquamicrobium defluvii TaxID=69279 RepID=UPI000A5AD691|nr:hypothetical protein [Aquamicrobium defluvii]
MFEKHLTVWVMLCIVAGIALGHMRGLLVFLTEDCCSGKPEICGDLNQIAFQCEPETRR